MIAAGHPVMVVLCVSETNDEINNVLFIVFHLLDSADNPLSTPRYSRYEVNDDSHFLSLTKMIPPITNIPTRTESQVGAEFSPLRL